MTVERHFFTLTLAAQAMLTLTLFSVVYCITPSRSIFIKQFFSFLLGLFIAFSYLDSGNYIGVENGCLFYSISGMMLLTIGYFGSRLIVSNDLQAVKSKIFAVG